MEKNPSYATTQYLQLNELLFPVILQQWTFAGGGIDADFTSDTEYMGLLFAGDCSKNEHNRKVNNRYNT